MNFRPETGFDSAYLALQALGLPIRERSQPSNHSLPNLSTTSLLPLNPITQPPRSAGLLPSPEFNFRPTTSNGIEYRPSSSAPETPSERPSTAPMTFSQMLPPRRELPFATILPKPPNRESGLASEDVSQPTSLQGQSSAKAPSRRKSRAKVAKAAAPDSQPDRVHPARVSESQLSITEPKRKKSRAQPAKKKAPLTVIEKERVVSTNTHEPPLMTAQHLQSDAIIQERHLESPQSTQAEQTKGQQDQQGTLVIPTAGAIEPPINTKADVAGTKQQAPTPLVLHVGKKAMAAISASETNARQNQSRTNQVEAHNATLKALSMEEMSPEEYMSCLDEWVRRYQHLPAPKPHPPPVSDLAGYAGQSEEDRLAALDSMICECLGDENFIKLVEDVDKSWKRIGLGF